MDARVRVLVIHADLFHGVRFLEIVKEVVGRDQVQWGHASHTGEDLFVMTGEIVALIIGISVTIEVRSRRIVVVVFLEVGSGADLALAAGEGELAVEIERVGPEFPLGNGCRAPVESSIRRMLLQRGTSDDLLLITGVDLGLDEYRFTGLVFRGLIVI